MLRLTPEPLDHENEETLPGCDQTCVEIKEKPYFRLGLFSNFDLNYVMTPYDDLLDKESYARTSFGYGSGLSIGWHYKNFAIRTGAIYSAKQYTPQPTVEIFSGSVSQGGYFTDELKNVDLNILEIPLHLEYTLKRIKKWGFYATSGASLNMAMQANYDRKQTFVGTQGFSGGQFTPPTPIAESITSTKKFSDGLFEGGSFKDNYYLTLDLGLGIERHLTNRWSVFVQPAYHHQLISKGLGPNEDRINTIRIFTGAKINLD